MGTILLSRVGGAWLGGGGELYIGAEGSVVGMRKQGAMPVVMIDEEKGKAHKTGYITLYAMLFRTSQKWNIGKNRKSFYVL